MTSIRLKIEESWYASMDCKVQKSGPWVCFYGGHSTGYKLGNHPKNIEPCAHRARTVRAPCAHRATTPPKGAPHRWSSPLPPAPCPCPSHTSLPWQRQWAVPRLPSYPPPSPGSASGRSHGCAPPSPLSCGACGRSHGCNPPPPPSQAAPVGDPTAALLPPLFPCSAGGRSHGCAPPPPPQPAPLHRRPSGRAVNPMSC